MWQLLQKKISDGEIKALARAISLIENEVNGYTQFLQSLPINNTPVIGITGPPGAGKSTLVDALIRLLINEEKKVAVLCVDPSSPFNLGSLLGDRIRMSEWYNNSNVYIRSLATRGSLGGLHPKIIEITDILKTANFDYIIVETVGVGQSEIEVAGLADVTIVVMVPEAGDEVQTMKAGLMEIANIFVVNKSDRPDAATFVKNLQLMMAPAFNNSNPIQIIKTIAPQQVGINELMDAIKKYLSHNTINSKRSWLLAEKAYHLISQKRMADINKEILKEKIENAVEGFNLYQFVKTFEKS